MPSERRKTSAILDDKVVADLLLQLKDSPPSPSPSPSPMFSVSIPPSWGLRQPRSKSASSLSKKRGPTLTPRSPTTPLSFRSKVSVAASDRRSSKRSTKKKNIVQLKQEQGLLLYEQLHLTTKLIELRATLHEQRTINENLKRGKVDLPVESRVKPEPMSLNGTSEATFSSVSRQVKTEDAWPAEKAAPSQKPIFLLPDLNMPPPEEECEEVLA